MSGWGRSGVARAGDGVGWVGGSAEAVLLAQGGASERQAGPVQARAWTAARLNVLIRCSFICILHCLYTAPLRCFVLLCSADRQHLQDHTHRPLGAGRPLPHLPHHQHPEWQADGRPHPRAGPGRGGCPGNCRASILLRRGGSRDRHGAGVSGAGAVGWVAGGGEGREGSACVVALWGEEEEDNRGLAWVSGWP